MFKNKQNTSTNIKIYPSNYATNPSFPIPVLYPQHLPYYTIWYSCLSTAFCQNTLKNNFIWLLSVLIAPCSLLYIHCLPTPRPGKLTFVDCIHRLYCLLASRGAPASGEKIRKRSEERNVSLRHLLSKLLCKVEWYGCFPQLTSQCVHL